jgi:galactose mutarotase-like enzyme
MIEMPSNLNRRRLLLAGAALATQPLLQLRPRAEATLKWKIHEGRYKDQTSHILETSVLAVTFIRHGGRMVSLRHKISQQEFLFEQPSDRYLRAEYARPMTPLQAAGYDDMFPTIDECFYPEAPWKGTPMPDHGEVWALDWNVAQDGQAWVFSVYGVRLPYHLSRRVTFSAENQLRLDYTLENLSPFELRFLWSAHPLLQVETGARIVLPPECRRAKSVLSLSGRLGSYGDEFDWPIWTDSRGTRHDLSVLRGPSSHDIEKYFFKEQLVNGWCKLTYPSKQIALKMSFPPKEVPYLAVVVGENARGDSRTYALLEPCSAPFDRLDVSTFYTNSSKLAPREKRNWFIEFSVDTQRTI